MWACNSNPDKFSLQSGMPDIKAYFQEQIKQLSVDQPGLDKTIAQADDIAAFSEDSLNWAAELLPFTSLDMTSASYAQAFNVSADSNERLSITRFTAKDTALEIQEISLTRRNQNLEMMEIKTRKRSMWVDRDQVLSYLPGKGYNIQITEDYIWLSPKRTEIMGTFKRQQFKP
jgi:hypothetical protein